MFRNIILTIIKDMWLYILISLLLVFLFRVLYLKISNKKFIFYKEMFILIFVTYMILLFRLVTFEDVSWSGTNLIPFKEMFRYKIGSELFIKNVIGNMIIFIPFGFFFSYFLDIKKSYVILLFTFIISLTIETLQFQIGRVFDIDDILLNLMGGVVGYFMFKLFNKLKRTFPNLLQKNFVYNIMLVVIIVIFILYLGGFLCLK